MTPSDVVDLLTAGELTVEGRVVAASNLTLYARVDDPPATLPCVYKPVSGERPLWDFPDGTLAARERAAYLVSEAGGWHLVPPTVLRDGPLGPGMCQQWVTPDERTDLIDVLPSADPPTGDPVGWLTVVRGRDERGRSVVLAHRDDPRLRDMAVLDAVLNNADRKGGHVLSTADGGLLGVDHGLCFHVEDKLRTVLWGWRGQPLTDADRQRLACLQGWLADHGTAVLGDLLTPAEERALRARAARLVDHGRMPAPTASWPSIPWPAF